MIARALALCAVLAAAGPGLAENAPYAGQDRREVSSFSPQDLDELRAGAGWGLAKPAELNGWPGPRHVLDFADELELTPGQRVQVEAVFDAMNYTAREQGASLIARERALDAAFESGEIDEAGLARLLTEAEAARTALRQTHLAAHLKITPLLTPHQKMTYARLRGYGEAGHGAHGSHDDH